MERMRCRHLASYSGGHVGISSLLGDAKLERGLRLVESVGSTADGDGCSEQSVQPVASPSSDFPPRKLVRHLDFTAPAYGGASPSNALSIALDPPQQLQQQPPPRATPASLPLSRASITAG
ncbi:hypothetical protein GW17_00014100 [Ensete ventricosum]|nr:hypothetical protein GW17_00014100 [Ensete ventricosum]RZR96414.1 hypothetical protein BHM03_00025435 [Ensete ventricosum]